MSGTHSDTIRTDVMTFTVCTRDRASSSTRLTSTRSRAFDYVHFLFSFVMSFYFVNDTPPTPGDPHAQTFRDDSTVKTTLVFLFSSVGRVQTQKFHVCESQSSLTPVSYPTFPSVPPTSLQSSFPPLSPSLPLQSWSGVPDLLT